jgi:hypothetical protein
MPPLDFGLGMGLHTAGDAKYGQSVLEGKFHGEFSEVRSLTLVRPCVTFVKKLLQRDIPVAPTFMTVRSTPRHEISSTFTQVNLGGCRLLGLR